MARGAIFTHGPKHDLSDVVLLTFPLITVLQQYQCPVVLVAHAWSCNTSYGDTTCYQVTFGLTVWSVWIWFTVRRFRAAKQQASCNGKQCALFSTSKANFLQIVWYFVCLVCEVGKKMDNIWFRKHDDIFFCLLKVLLCESISSSNQKLHQCFFEGWATQNCEFKTFPDSWNYNK